MNKRMICSSVTHATHPYSSTMDLFLALTLLTACQHLSVMAHYPDHHGLLFLHLSLFSRSTIFANSSIPLFLHGLLGSVSRLFRGWNFGEKAICHWRLTSTWSGTQTRAPRKYVNNTSSNVVYSAERVGRCIAYSVDGVREKGWNVRYR